MARGPLVFLPQINLRVYSYWQHVINSDRIWNLGLGKVVTMLRSQVCQCVCREEAWTCCTSASTWAVAAAPFSLLLKPYPAATGLQLPCQFWWGQSPVMPAGPHYPLLPHPLLCLQGLLCHPFLQCEDCFLPPCWLRGRPLLVLWQLDFGGDPGPFTMSPKLGYNKGSNSAGGFHSLHCTEPCVWSHGQHARKIVNHTGSRPAQVLKPHIQIIDEQGPFSNRQKQGRGDACKGHNLMRASSVANERRISTCTALLLQTLHLLPVVHL